MGHIRKQKPYGSKMEKFDVVGRSSRCSQSTDKHLHVIVRGGDSAITAAENCGGRLLVSVDPVTY